MATSTSLGRSGPNLSLFFLIITVLSFSGTSLAATPLAILRRQPQPLPECVQMCTPPANEMGTFCKLSGSEKLERLKQCANGLCQGNEEQVQQVVVLNVGLCNEGITAPASVDIATVTSLLADTGATSLAPATTPTTTTTTVSSTSSAPVTPTANANSSNDDSSGGRTKENKKGSDLSIPIIVAIAVGGTVFLGMCVGLWYLLRCLKKRKRREREQKNGGAKGFDNSSISDLDNGSKRGIPLGNASRKEMGRGVPWIDEENNNSSTAQLYNTSAMDKPRRLPPISTKFAPSVPQRPSDRLGNNSSGDVSPVSPVSPLSEYATYDERRSKAISTVSSMKPERTHRDFYNVSSPPLPTPASAIGSRYPSTRLPSKNKPANLNIGPGITDRPESEYPPEPVSPLSRNPSGKSIGARSEVSAIGEEHFAWESYRDTIRKYEEQQAQGQPISPEVIQRLSGLSQFNFGFGESQSPVESEKKRESSFYGWAPEKSSGGHLDVPSGQNRNKYLSDSSSMYSSQPMTPPPPITRDAGPSTPEMFFGRPPPSYTPPSPPPATASRSFIGVRQPSSHKPEPPTGGLAKANSLRWRREVEAATDQALKKIADPNDDKGESQQKSSGFWSLLTPKLSGASPKIGKVPSGTGSVNQGSWPNVAHQAASSEVSLVSEDGRSGVVII